VGSEMCIRDSLLLRVPPEVHAKASIAAKVAGLSLNQWAAKALDQATHA
jgi:predicted HicB family RNase H-like nuclease